MNKTRPKLSIASTIFLSEETIERFVKSVNQIAQKITNEFEIVLIDDGSPDNSVKKVQDLNIPVKIVRFSKNEGHHIAMMAAIEHSRGEFIFLIDSDLEESPDLILEFWNEFHSHRNIDVLYGVQETRRGKIREKVSGGLFYSLFNFFSETKISPNLLTVRLMNRRYVDSLMEYKEANLFIGGVWAHAGFTQLAKTVKKSSTSQTSYTLKKKIEMVINSITSFSSKPLTTLFKLSMLINIITLLYILRTFYLWLFNDENISGYASIIISLWFFGGLTITSISILGLYISKIFDEVKKRPCYSIKETLNL